MAALKDGALSALVGATTILGAGALGIAFLPALAVIGVTVPAIQAAWKTDASEGKQYTYFCAQ